MTAVKKRPARKATRLEVVELLVDDLIADEDNPNEMDEATFDQLVEEIREQGFDEPVLVRLHPTAHGKYQISSGHHRVKAAKAIGLTTLPAVIKKWSDREQKVALVKRNALRGKLDKTKMVRLYQSLAKGRDAVQVQRELGFTNPKQFEQLYGVVEKQLPPAQRKKLQEAKETIKSVDDLSSVLNRIFKEAGSEVEQGYMVFSFGGKEHHYFQITDETNAKLKAIKAHCEANDIIYKDFVQSIVASVDLPSSAKPATRRRSRKPTGE